MDGGSGSGKVVIRLEIDGSGNARVLTDTETGIDNLGKAAKRSGGGLSDLALGVLAAESAVSKLHEIAGKAERVLDDLVHRGSAMDSVMLKIGARTTDGAEGVKGLREELGRLSVEFGKPTAELGQSALTIVSEGANSAAKAVKILTPSLVLAKGANAELATSAFIVQRGMEAFGISTNKAAEFANDLFIATDEGRDSLEELGQATIANAGKARQLGVSHRELLATEVALQKEGRNLSEITGGLGAILGGLMRPNEDLEKSFKRLGVTTGDELVKKFGGLLGALEKVRTDMQKNGEGFVKAFRGADTYSIALTAVNRAAIETPGLMDKMATNTDALTKRVDAQSGSLEGLEKKWQAIRDAISEEAFFAAIEQFKGLAVATNEVGKAVLEFTKAHPGLVQIGVAFLQGSQKVTSFTASVLDFLVAAAALRIMLPALGTDLAKTFAWFTRWAGPVAAAVTIGGAFYAIGTKIGSVLESNAGHAKTNAEAMAEVASKTGLAQSEVERLANTPPLLLEADMTAESITELKDKVEGAYTQVQAALKAGNTELARALMDDLLAQYGAQMSRLPKPTKVTLFGREVEVDDPLIGEARDLFTAVGKTDKGIARSKPPGDPKKWSDVLSEIREKYQGFVDAENALTEAAEAHVKALAAAKAPADVIGAAVKETVVHQKAALEATIALNEALLNAGKSAGAPQAELTKFSAEIDIAKQKLSDLASLVGASVQAAVDEVTNAGQPRLDTLSAIVEARQAEYELAVELIRPQQEILDAAKRTQDATNESSAAAADLAKRVADVAKASGASAEEMDKYNAVLSLAQTRANDLNSVMREAHRTVKGMYETVKIDLPSAFRQGMRDSFAAVVAGTRSMGDVWKGVKESITGQFADAFAAIIFGKKAQFDDPMEKNLGGISDLFGSTANDARGHFGGLFQWISNGFSRLFGTGSLQSANVKLSDAAVQTGAVGLGTPSGGTSLFGSAGAWFKDMFNGTGSFSGGWSGMLGSIGSWFKGLFASAPGKTIGQYDIPVGGSAVVDPKTGTMTAAPAQSSFSSFSSSYGQLIGMLGAALSGVFNKAMNKTETMVVDIASKIPVYGYLAYAYPILKYIVGGMGSALGWHAQGMGQDWLNSIFNPLALVLESKKSERDLLRTGLRKTVGAILGSAHPDMFTQYEAKHDVVPSGGGISMTQRAIAGLDTSQLAKVMALVFLGGLGKKPFQSHDEQNPNINNAGWLGAYNTTAGQMQALLDKYPDMAEEFAKDILNGLGGGLEHAIDVVQKGIRRVVEQTQRADNETLLYAYQRLTGQVDDPFFTGDASGKLPDGSQLIGGIGKGIMPTVQQAVAELVLALTENLPLAIRKNIQKIMDDEFARTAAGLVPGSPEAERSGGLPFVKGAQITRAIEIQQDAFEKMASAFGEAGKAMLEGATREQALDVFRGKLREAVTKAFAEGIASSFIANVIEDNLVAPILTKLDRGMKAAMDAKTPGAALNILDDLILALGSDLAEMEKQVAGMAPLIARYAKMQERIALAVTSFDDVAKAAKELAQTLRGSIAQFTNDLETQHQLAAQESRRLRRRSINDIERRFGGLNLDDIGAVNIAGLSDTNLKRMPDLLERARAAIVANAEIELNFLSQRLSMAKQWADLALPAKEALSAVENFGRQNTRPALEAFELGRTRMQELLKAFKSDDEATRLSAARDITSFGPQLLELARQAGIAPGTLPFENIRATLESTLSEISKEAAAREVEALQLQRNIDRVQKDALDQLKALAEIAKGVEAEARTRQLELLDEAINYDALQLGALQTQGETMEKIASILDRGINVVEIARGKDKGFPPTSTPGLSEGGLVLGNPRLFMLHPPEVVVPLDRVGRIMGGGNSVSIALHQTVTPPVDEAGRARAMRSEEEALFMQQLRRAVRDPAMIDEIMQIARKAQQEA